VQPRAVYLRDRRRGERLGVELGEELADRLAELRFDLAARRLPPKGGTASCSLRSSSTRLIGTRSGRVARICPSFTKVGPSSSNAIRMRSSVV